MPTRSVFDMTDDELSVAFDASPGQQAQATRSVFDMTDNELDAAFAPPSEPIGKWKAGALGLAAGMTDIAQSVGTGLQWAGERLGSDRLKEAGKTTEQYWGEAGKRFEPPKELQGAIAQDLSLLGKGAWWTYNVMRTAPSFAASIIPGVGAFKYLNIAGKALKLTPGLVTKLASIGAAVTGGAVGGALEGTGTYQEIKEKGGTDAEAAAGAEMMTLASAGLNALSVGKMLSPAAKSRALHYLASGVTESVTEYLEGPAEAGILYGMGKITGKEAAQKMVEEVNVVPPSFVLGMVGGAGGKRASRQYSDQPPPAASLAEALGKSSLEELQTARADLAASDPRSPTLAAFDAAIREKTPIIDNDAENRQIIDKVSNASLQDVGQAVQNFEAVLTEQAAQAEQEAIAEQTAPAEQAEAATEEATPVHSPEALQEALAAWGRFQEMERRLADVAQRGVPYPAYVPGEEAAVTPSVEEAAQTAPETAVAAPTRGGVAETMSTTPQGEIVAPGAETVEAAPPAAQGQPVAKEPWEMTREEFESSPPRGFQIKKLGKEDIARAESDGTISVDPDNFFGHAEGDRKSILDHERAHFLEEKISPEYKASLFDNLTVMNYRGRNINEKLANMIQDGKLPPEVLKDYPELAKPAESATIPSVTEKPGTANIPAQEKPGAEAVDFSKDPAWHDIAYRDPTEESLTRLKGWLKGNPGAVVRLYHGTDASLPIETDGLKPTGTRTAKSLQSRHGVVSLSIYPGQAHTFGKMAYPGKAIQVYAVDLPVNQLIPDADQLKNKRMWGEKPDIGGTLADSIALGHGAQVRGAIPADRLMKVDEKGNIPPKTTPKAVGGIDENTFVVDTAYHGTSSRHARNIKKKGFLPADKHGMPTATVQPNGISLTIDRKIADQFGDAVSNFTKGSKPEVLEVDTRNLKIFNDPTDDWAGHNEYNEFISDIKRRGYDAVRTDTGESEIYVFNIDKLKLKNPNPSRPPESGGQSAPAGKEAAKPVATPSAKLFGDERGSVPLSSESEVLQAVQRAMESLRKEGQKGPLNLEPSQEIPNTDDPQAVDAWLKDQFYILQKTLAGLRPKNLPHMTYLEQLLSTPSYFQHPVLAGLHRIFQHTRSDRFHDLMGQFTDDNAIIRRFEALQKDGAAYKALAYWTNRIDTTYAKPKRNEGESAEDYGKRVLADIQKTMRDGGASQEVMDSWMDGRRAYDRALDVELAQIAEFRQALEKKAKARHADLLKRKTAAEQERTALEGVLSKDLTEEQTKVVQQKVLQTQSRIRALGKDISAIQDAYDASQAEMKALRDQVREMVVALGELRYTYAPRIRRGDYYTEARRSVDGALQMGRWQGTRREMLAKAQALRRQGWEVSAEAREVRKLPDEVYQNVNLLDMAQIIDEAMSRMEKADREKIAAEVKARKAKGEEVDMKAVLQANASYASDVQTKLLQSMVDVVKLRGHRSTHLHRNRDMVVQGYITDPTERLVRYLMNKAGGFSKAEAAFEASRLVMGERGEGGERIGGIDAMEEPRAYEVARQYIAEQLRNRDHADALVDASKTLAAIKFLALNAKAAVVNTTSMITTSPGAIHQEVLDGKGSIVNVQKEIFRAVKDYGRFIRDGALPDLRETAFLWDMKRKGQDNPQLTREAQSAIDRLSHQWLASAMDVGMWPMSITEQLNRGGTMLAAYRLGIKRHGKESEARERALMASSRANAEYGRANYPVILQGSSALQRIGQSAYTFVNFPHNYLQQLYNLGVRKKNAKAFLWTLAAPLVLAGGVTFPYADALQWLVEGMLRLAGVRGVKLDKWWWDTVRDSMGQGAEKLLRHGLLGMLGVDISGSLSIGVGVPKNAYEMLGAAGGVAADVTKAARYIGEEAYGRAAEKLLPTAVANLLRGERESREGASTERGQRLFDESGRPYMPGTSDVLRRMAGFRPTEQAYLASRREEIEGVRQDFADEKERIQEEYRFYLLNPQRTEADFLRIHKKIQEYNRQLRERAPGLTDLRITYRGMRTQIKNLARPVRRQRNVLQEMRQ